jgi:hypothetical protein
MSKNFKRVLACGDSHCGHRVGLTPPKYQSAIPGDEYYRIQVELWDFFKKEVEALLPIDILVLNGDLIDGKGGRSGSSELITADINRQRDIAVDCFEWIGATNIVVTYGTPYHTGVTDDDEKEIANRLGADIRGQQWIDVNDTVFDIKHFVGNTSVPYSKGTQLSKDRYWNLIWTEFDEQPKADVVLRSHIHNFFQCGEDHWLAVALPALQGQGSKFGSRKCSSHVDFGIAYFDCYEEGGYSWSRRILRAESQKQQARKL